MYLPGHMEQVSLTTFQLLKHKADIMELLSILADKTFSERGYSGTGRLIQRVLNTLVGVYPLNARFVNTDVWNSEGMYF
jgi:proteasome activator subunit 4